MAVIGTFGSFTAARLGIYASQASLNATGNNIANINTDGYTRQRMDLISLHSWGTARYANKFNQDIGYGVLTNGVSQLRDPFIDIRYRDEQSNVGFSEKWLDCLKQLSHTLDEVGDGDDFGIVERQFNDFAYQLQQLNDHPGTTEYDTIVRSSAKVLTNLLNSYAKSLETVEDTQTKNLKDDVTSVNTILTQIRSLNEEIREAGIHGAKALELRDERNVLIDKLSTYMKIEVSYDNEKLDEFNSVERLNINVAGSGNPPTRLVCGIYATQLEMGETTAMRNPEYNFDDLHDPNNAGKKKYVQAEPNPDYDPNDPDKSKLPEFIPKVGADGKYVCTDNPMTKSDAIAEAEKKGIDPATVRYDPNNPWAYEVNNALTGEDNQGDNRVWMNLQPLVTEKGRVFKDADGNPSKRVELGDNTLYGSLQAMREFVTGKGEFSSELDIQYKDNATEVRGVPYFRKSLDALAQKFAKMFNEANQVNLEDVAKVYKTDGTSFVDVAGAVVNGIDGQPIEEDYFDEVLQEQAKLTDKTLTLTDAQKEEIKKKVEDAYKNLEVLRNEGVLRPEYAYYDGGVMFSSSGDTNDMTGITAKNITIAKGWSTGEVRILSTKKPDILKDPSNPDAGVITHTTDNNNIAHMINLMGQKLDYFAQDTVPEAANEKRYFNGSFQGRLADMNVILAVDQETTTTLYNSYSVKSLSLENDRQSVSGVDLNDEATNMMVFQKAYSAACQLMTTLDSMLERLINGTL